MNGMQCGSPALHRRRRCFFHERAREQQNRIVRGQCRQARFVLPVLEDANAVQMALMEVMQLLAWGEMDRKVAALLLYGLQTASANLRYVNFEPSEPTDVVIFREDTSQTDIGGPQWDPENFGFEEEEDEEEIEKEGEGGNVAAAPRATEAAVVVAAAGETGDLRVAAAEGAEKVAVPSKEEVRKRIRGLVHEYIVSTTGREPMELSG